MTDTPEAVERLAIDEPSMPGGFVGDIWFGHPEKSTLGTHRWTGAEWEVLPSEAEVLLVLLAKVRAESAALAAEVLALRAKLAEAERALERLRHDASEMSEPDFIWGALDNVHDCDTTLDNYAAAVSRAQRAALSKQEPKT